MHADLAQFIATTMGFSLTKTAVLFAEKEFLGKISITVKKDHTVEHNLSNNPSLNILPHFYDFFVLAK